MCEARRIIVAVVAVPQSFIRVESRISVESIETGFVTYYDY
jgi:hypothetical protein